MGILSHPTDDQRDHHREDRESVMNYDRWFNGWFALNSPPWLLGQGFNEPDCSPHPMDIMAMYALY